MNITEKELDQTLHVSLLSVAEDMARLNGNQIANMNPVSQLSGNYFVVAINDKIDANVLEHYLSSEFRERGLTMDYEYGIYDCYSDKMVYGNYVGSKDVTLAQTELPTWDDNIYYFGVRFPQRKSYLFRELRFWVFSTILVLLVLLVFAYSLFIILKQRRLSEVQKDFVNTMTHEFKTPLSTIAISANVLAEAEPVHRDERLKKYIHIVQEENEQLKKQVDKLLQMTDLEKDKIELKLEEIDLHELLLKITSHIQLRVSENKGKLTTSLKAVHPYVHADRVHLTNMIYNLLDNAIKYSPTNLEVDIQTMEQNENIELCVRDRGKGISKEEQKKVFQKFYRVPTGDVHDVSGFGLGLSYIGKLVKVHGWKIDLQSEIGKGSTFKMIIPKYEREA